MADESLLQVARIAAGEFVMGADDGEEDERPVHRIYIDDFAIGKYPVTNGEYAQFVRETGHPSPAVRSLPLMAGALESDFRSVAAGYFWNNGTPPEGRDRHPVTLVGFDDATRYCAWLATRRAARAAAHRSRVGARRARRPRRQALSLGRHARRRARALPSGRRRKAERGTASVGSYPPNAFELHDMAGNVWEWVSDWYSPNYYERAEYINPQGPDSGIMRIVRGGAWVNADGRYLRCAYRHKVPPDSYAYSIGFRIAYSLK